MNITSFGTRKGLVPHVIRPSARGQFVAQIKEIEPYLRTVPSLQDFRKIDQSKRNIESYFQCPFCEHMCVSHHCSLRSRLFKGLVIEQIMLGIADRFFKMKGDDMATTFGSWILLSRYERISAI